MAKHPLLILLIAFLSYNIYPQIVFRGISGAKVQKEDLEFLGQSGFRNKVILNGDWEVYAESDGAASAARVNVPSVFEGDRVMIFEKSFRVQPEDLKKSLIKITFLGISYSAEISINGSLIYRHFGGEMPFSFDVPRDQIYTDKNNILSVKLNPRLDSETTFPIFQRYLFPASHPGILRDVFIEYLPLINIASFNSSYTVSSRGDLLRLKINSRIGNFDYAADSAGSAFELSAALTAMSTGATSESRGISFDLKKGKEKNLDLSIESASPLLWSPETPQHYELKLKLYRNGVLIDEIFKTVSFFSLVKDQDSLMLNGNRFRFNGVIYYPGSRNTGSIMAHPAMASDLELIKETGFNAVRFAKALPDPYLLSVCERIGLFAFVEIPLNSIPVSLVNSPEFINRAKGYINRTLKQYSSYSAIAAFGIGSSYVPGIEPVQFFASEMAKHAKHQTNKFIYASFTNSDIEPVKEIDFYGIECVNVSVEEVRNEYNALIQKVGKDAALFADLGYSNHSGNSNGYVNPYSFEAQAKFFNEFFLFAEESGVSGFFINSMFDYYPAATPITIRPHEDGSVPLGLSGVNRSKERLSYKAVSAWLNNEERVSIPIGIREHKAPAVFIIAGLLAAFLIGAMINSGKKFREDSVRALLRPYNFYADIRDVRLISGFQTVMLAVIVALISGDILASLLHYARFSPFFEKTVISFASPGLTSFFSSLAWSPVMSVIWMTVISLIAILSFTLCVKIGSLFVMNKVSLQNSFFAVVWSFVPFALLTPLVIILYRLLEMDYANLYIYLFTGFFYIWALFRLFKGMYVIYDVAPGKVFFYGLVFIIVVKISLLMYFQYNYGTIDQIHYALLQSGGGSH